LLHGVAEALVAGVAGQYRAEPVKQTRQKPLAPDGQPNVLRHDHVLPVAPGDRGYTGSWTLNLLVEATPGSIDLATHPITTAAQVRAALAAGLWST
jgi:hypothetical protein